MPLAVYTTLADPDMAHRIAYRAVDKGLAACVHIEEVRSLYRWDGEVQDELEYRLLFKVSKHGYDALAAFILRDHPYEEPALWAVEMQRGSEGFFDWIRRESTGG